VPRTSTRATAYPCSSRSRTYSGRYDGGAAVAGRALDPLFSAVVEATEEAVLNSLLTSTTTVGRAGNTSEGLDPDTVVGLLREHGRL
jgi:D-aminopeptidase